LIAVDAQSCCACGGCVPACPVGSIHIIVNNRAVIAESCVGCGKCIPFCPHGALHFPEEKGDRQKPIQRWFRPPDSEYDIVVVGGGPAGSTAARFAAEQGAKVLLVEKRPIVGTPQLCAEGVSHSGLADVIPEIREKWIAAPIIGAILVSPEGRKTTVQHPKAGYILERRVFDRDLFSMAAKAGARTLIAAEAIDFIKTDDHIVGVTMLCRGQSYEILCKAIICADGVESGMLSRLFPKEHLATDQIHVASQVVMSGVEVRPGFPEFHIGRNLAPGGYAWVFPKGEAFANVGLGLNPSIGSGESSWDLLERFVERRFAGEGEIIEVASGNVPTAKRFSKIVYRNVLFIGDAGRLSDPVSGGGIASALLSGRIAGQLASEAVRAGTPEKTEIFLSRFTDLWDKLKGRQFAFYWKAKTIFAALDDDDLEAICRVIEDRFGHGVFESIDIPGAIKSIIRERKLFWKVAKGLYPKGI